MKYELRGILYTNLNFTINIDCFDAEFKKSVVSIDSDARYEISYKTESAYSLMMFLEQLIVSYRVTYVMHYDLLLKLIEMTMYVHELVKWQNITCGIIIKNLEKEDYESSELALVIKQ